MATKKKIIPASSRYPIDFITYNRMDTGQPPEFTQKVLNDVRRKGFSVLPLTPDNYKVVKAGTKKGDIPEGFIGSWHAGFKHLRDITMPKLLALMDTNTDIKGFLIAEADLCMRTDYDYKRFIHNLTPHPTWLGWKKILKKKGEIDYIVGNFLIYIPRDKMVEFNRKLQAKKSLVYSDRFYTNLVKEGFMKVARPSAAGEIVHVSQVAGGKTRRKSQAEEECHLNEEPKMTAFPDVEDER